MLAWYLCRSIDSAVVSETIYKCLEKGPIRQTRWHSAIASATKSHRYLPLGSGLNVSEHSEPFSVLLFSEIRLMLPSLIDSVILTQQMYNFYYVPLSSACGKRGRYAD